MEKKKTDYLRLIKRFLPYYKKYRLVLFLDLFCAALTTVCELVLPMIVRSITNAATAEVMSLTVEFVVRCGVFYLILRVIDTFANYYMATHGHIMGTKIETDMRHDFFAHLQKLSFSYYDVTKTGTLMSRITSDLFDITEFSHHGPEEIFIASIKIICSFIILLTVNVPLTLIMFICVPPLIFVLGYFSRKMKNGFRESRKQVGELNSQIEDSLLGVRIVKSFAKEEYEQQKFDKGNNKFLSVKTNVYKIMGTFFSCTRLADGVMYIVVVVAGALFLISGSITAADYIAYLLYVSTLMTSIRRIVEFSEQFQRGMTGIERFAEVMDIEPDIVDSFEATELTNVSGNILIDNISFKYNGEENNVIEGLSLEIKPGENVALVGPSGGGKTTLCSLIPRFYDVTDGQILIDGIDIKAVTLRSLREKIGVVAQDVYLFSGSVRENIAYGNPNATDEDIINAAKLAGAHEFITSLVDGYDTYVGERGVKLSGGQKQRISIARVFLKNPPILILDEATSALDNESERLVQQSLERLVKGRTTITIAHRLTTIKNADRIIVLTENGIEEMGSHRELLEKRGLYFKLYEMYSAN